METTKIQVQGPFYWMDEISGRLAAVVKRYIEGAHLSREDLATMRAYLRQWMLGDFRGQAAAELRLRVDGIVDERTLNDWMRDALTAGIDPL